MEKIDMHKLLVNGIIGAAPEMAETLWEEFGVRGLAEYDWERSPRWKWERAALDALPNHMLVGIYERVTA